MCRVLNKLSENIYCSISQSITSYAFLLVFKIVKSLQGILKERNKMTNSVNSNTNEAENQNINFTNMEDVAELPRKAKFRSLDEVTNEENFYGLKQVENKQYNFSTANKQFQMKWFTKNRNIRNVGRQPASNVVEREIGPIGPAKDVTTPLEAWQ